MIIGNTWIILRPVMIQYHTRSLYISRKHSLIPTLGRALMKHVQPGSCDS